MAFNIDKTALLEGGYNLIRCALLLGWRTGRAEFGEIDDRYVEVLCSRSETADPVFEGGIANEDRGSEVQHER